MNILYSFRRCPYAIRARMAIAYSGQSMVLREVVLRDKPPEMIQASPKATVPVLQLADGTVIEESLEVMLWALQQSDPDHWLRDWQDGSVTRKWIADNDGWFKQALDRYKYADRYPEYSQQAYRERGEVFLQRLDQQLADQDYLLDDQLSLLDVAVLPFIRQFAHVDKPWFDQSDYPYLRAWLYGLLEAPVFTSVMQKYPQWHSGDPVTLFPSTN